MEIFFYKYQGTGNDFIMLDNRDGRYDAISIAQIQQLCDRKFGIGADGLICINSHEKYAFEVDYSNSDGSKSFCGNGARCSVAFAQFLGISCDEVTFLAIDGEHQAKWTQSHVSVQMQNVVQIREINIDTFELNTGSPHYIHFVSPDSTLNIVEFGKHIRYSSEYSQEGINVNLVKKYPQYLHVETYERGVEDETLSCGTGVTAAVIADTFKSQLSGKILKEVKVKGGELAVELEAFGNSTFTNIWLIGPAKMVFKGSLHV
jgi:diaminopimelate epimerase